MTEQEWSSETPPAEWLLDSAVLRFLHGRTSERKLRLFAVACCQRVKHLLDDERSRFALETAERHADGLASEVELAEAEREAVELANAHRGDCEAALARAAAAYVAAKDVLTAANITLWYSIDQFDNCRDEGRSNFETLLRWKFLHDIIGNPFRPISADPCWLSSTVVSLAQGIYDDRAFDRLPILADALEDAGCTNAAILAHCRGPDLHVRGCWVLDLLLGKE